MKWDSSFYDDKHGFVSELGSAVLDILAPQPGERILDLGCGTGDLMVKMDQAGAKTVGIDYSSEMIQKAREKNPHLEFHVMGAQDFHFQEPFDAVFSNAALHWVLDKENAIKSIYNSLRRGGRFVAEFGGRGNIQNILQALRKTLADRGHGALAQKQQWYFPSLGEYSSLLESWGFHVLQAAHFKRDTPLDGQEGVKNWIRMFGKSYFEGLEDKEVNDILDEVESILRPSNYKDGKWYADYLRLRIQAVKE